MARSIYIAQALTLLAMLAGIGLFFYIIFKIWGEEKSNYFLFVGDYESAAIVLGIVFVFGWVLKKLWKWEVHTLFPAPRRRVR